MSTDHFSSWLLNQPATSTKGGEGSGNFSHDGRPGMVGGSAPRKGGGNYGHAGQEGKRGGSKPNEFRHLRRETIRKHGFTWDPHGKTDVKQGYAISPYNEAEKVVSTKDFKTNGMAILRNYMKAHADLLSQPGAHVGGWYDKESKKVFLDVALVTHDKGEAIRQSDAHKQIAFYSLHEGKEYRMSEMDPQELAQARSSQKAKKTKAQSDSRLHYHTLPGDASEAELQDFVKSLTDAINGDEGEDGTDTAE